MREEKSSSEKQSKLPYLWNYVELDPLNFKPIVKSVKTWTNNAHKGIQIAPAAVDMLGHISCFDFSQLTLRICQVRCDKNVPAGWNRNVWPRWFSQQTSYPKRTTLCDFSAFCRTNTLWALQFLPKSSTHHQRSVNPFRILGVDAQHFHDAILSNEDGDGTSCTYTSLPKCQVYMKHIKFT